MYCYKINGHIYGDNGDNLLDEIKEIIIIEINDYGWKFVNAIDSREHTEYEYGYFPRELQFEKKTFLKKRRVFCYYSSKELKWAEEIKEDGSYSPWSDKERLPFFEGLIPKINSMIEGKEEKRQKQNIDEIIMLKSILSKKVLSLYFIEKLKQNQNKLEQKAIANLLKVYSFYEKQITSYNLIYDNMNAIDFHKGSTYRKDEVVNKIKNYSKQIEKLEGTQNALIDAYANGDLITFYTIYNKFDEMGLFIKGGEKAIIENLQSLNHNLNYVISSIEDVNATIEKIGNKLIYQ